MGSSSQLDADWPTARPTASAAVAPASSWPSAPMFITPAVNARVTARPVRISGVARTSVAEKTAYCEPNEPCQRAPSATRGSWPARGARIATSAAIARIDTAPATSILPARSTPRRRVRSPIVGGGTLDTPRLRCRTRSVLLNTESRRTCRHEPAHSFRRTRPASPPWHCRRSPRERAARAPSLDRVSQRASAVARAWFAYGCMDAGMCSNPSSITQWGTAAPSVNTTTFHATLNPRNTNHGRQRDPT